MRRGLKASEIKHLGLITVIASVFFIPFLGTVHLFDWDEINFAESAREMMITGDYTRVQIDFKPFWEKPPLFFWIQVVSMSLFGVTEFGARFPNALCGIITLGLIYLIGARRFGERFGLFWALAYFGSMTPHFYFKTGIIDPYFNLFIFLSLYFIIDLKAENRVMNSLMAGGFAGLAVLTKGPVGGAMVVLTVAVERVVSYYQKGEPGWSWGEAVRFGVAALLVSSLWYGVELVVNGPAFFVEFIDYQRRLFFQSEAGHAQPFYYHAIVLLLGVFPASFMAFSGYRRVLSRAEERAFFRWMQFFFWVPFIAVSLATTKIVHYSSLCYFSMTFFAAIWMREIVEGKAIWSPRVGQVLLGFGGVIALLMTLFPLALCDPERILPYISDPLTKAVLTTPVEWGGWEWGFGPMYAVGIVMAFWLLGSGKYEWGFGTLFFSTVLILHLFTFVLAPKIEEYTQARPIRFYQSKATEDAYIMTTFKSYAPFFYGQKRKPERKEATEEGWLLEGEIDKPVYIVAKVTQTAFLAQYSHFEELSREGGFVYLVRHPKREKE